MKLNKNKIISIALIILYPLSYLPLTLCGRYEVDSIFTSTRVTKTWFIYTPLRLNNFLYSMYKPCIAFDRAYWHIRTTESAFKLVCNGHEIK